MTWLIPFFLFAFAAPAAELGPDDAKVILGHFLDIGDPKLNDLEMMNRRGEVYAKYRKAALGSDKTGMKVLLFYARLTPRHHGADSEALLSDLVPAYEAAPETFLGVLKDQSETVAPACAYLAGHFGFEGVPAAARKVFLAKNKAKIQKRLGKDAGLCLSQFN
jgi:hypothetical protein